MASPYAMVAPYAMVNPDGPVRCRLALPNPLWWLDEKNSMLWL
jgi:hypothetical protein